MLHGRCIDLQCSSWLLSFFIFIFVLFFKEKKIVVFVLWCLYHGGGDGASGVAATLVALHVASHAEGLAAAGVSAAEWLLAGVAVRMDA